MKKFLFIITYLFLFSQVNAQTGNVGIGTNLPDGSAILDISSSTKGLLIPRISITSASSFGLTNTTNTEGMIVYNTNASITGGNGKGFYYWNGSSWSRIANGNLPATLSNGKIWIGDATNNPAEQTMSGDGTISNSGVLDLNNLAVETSEIADNAVDGTKINISGNANGDLMYYNGTDWVRLASGTTGQVLQTNGTAAPTWVNTTKNVKAQNGLNIATATPNATATDPYVELGGNLVRGTTITQDNNAFTILNNNASNTTINLSSTGDFDVQDNGTSSLFVRDDGNVGINNNLPTAKLHILVPADANSAPASNGIYVYNTGNVGDNDDAIITTRVNGANAGDPFFSMDIDGVTGWSIGIDNSDADKLKFSNSWSDPGTNARMTITTTGDVGIGTEAPATKVDIRGILSMNDYAIRLRPGTDANHQIVYTSAAANGTTVDGPSIQGCTGIEFRRNCTAVTLGTWTGSSLDVVTGNILARNGLQTERHIRFYKRSRSNGNGGTDNLGNYDFCYLGGAAFRNSDSATDEDDDYQCNVFTQDINASAEYNEGENEDFSANFSYNTRPYWKLYSECYQDCSNTTCTAFCINFDY